MVNAAFQVRDELRHIGTVGAPPAVARRHQLAAELAIAAIARNDLAYAVASSIAPYPEGMARDESDREDLLREATALVERIELAPADAADDEHIVAGFRRDGALSIYFGADPVYHFNSAGELRRAYCDGS